MRFYILVLLSLFYTASVSAQHFYTDVIGNKQTNQQYRLIRSFKVKKISAASYEGNQPSKDFLLEQIVSNDGKQMITHSAAIGNAESYFISNYSNNRVERTVDSSTNAIVTVDYTYDNAGRVISINSVSRDFDGKFTNSEIHNWLYNDKGFPEKMTKVRNNADTTNVTFKLDEEDNIAEEYWIKNNRVIETYYYYYNPKKQLTDVVRFSKKAKRMLPDFMFEYDNTGKVSQMTQTQAGTANYLVWRYNYNANGLKEKEVVYNKQKEMLGKIEYSYQ